METNLDRRVVRTRKLLQDALFALILEHGYDSIRVQDITDAANLGRATFYKHYPDKESLLFATIEGLRDNLRDSILRNPAGSMLPGFRALFQHAEENPNFYLVVLNHVGGRESITQVMNSAVIHFLQKVETGSDHPVEFMANYIVGAVLQLLDWWMLNDKPYSIEEMEQMLWVLIRDGLPIEIENG